MPEHFTKNTLECTAWCNTCQRPTQHDVSCGRRGRCKEHSVPHRTKIQERRLVKSVEKQICDREQPKLF
jgi:hypothetical protein